ncbi:MAG: hypothetical protein J6S61_04695 [Elusimicrobiaceae bacterium]|nr:hypothetical protein [Elusimicrobiaceae bacterium]
MSNSSCLLLKKLSALSLGNVLINIPNIVPNSSRQSSLLYLDSDIIVKGSIVELLNTDISGCYIAASYEFYCHLDRIRYSLHRSVSNDFYFNSGVMLLNLKRMREDSISESLWNYKLNKSKTKLMDQESLNAVCGLKSISLPIIWNFNPRFLSRKLLTEINKVYLTDYVSIDELEHDIKIIHYVGKPDKPWIYSTAHMRYYWDVIYKRLKWTSSLNLLEKSEYVSKINLALITAFLAISLKSKSLSHFLPKKVS